MNNLILLTDSYKVTHWKQYPPNTQAIYSYLESRGGEYTETVFFGLQYILKKYFLRQITRSDLDEAKHFWNQHFGQDIFNYDGWKYIIDKHDGYLPSKIQAVKEGSVINTSNVLMTIENTDTNVPWLTNWLETVLMQIWYPSTVATQSRWMKRILLESLKLTGTPEDIDFKLHDFGFRGSTSVESAGIGGMAHLVNFKGTDTSPGFMFAKMYYGEEMAGFSIPAAEHSTITSWGQDYEITAYRNMLQQYPTGLVAVVSDSYDIYNACKEIWGNILKEQVLERDGVLVIRPDSGDPNKVIPNILDILGNKFGYAENDRGYKVLNPKVRLIQGDGIEPLTMSYILRTMEEKGWSADNIAFGSGGALLQKVNRDTCKYAIKCSAIQQFDKWFDVYKDPMTDSSKKSKPGRLALVQGLDDKYITIKETNGNIGNLELVYENGQLIREQSFSEIRQLANKGV